ncbi:MAG: multidrug ABC transporter permease [Alphaproteobacteria bacterium]|nr:multidrug ABC transporter permease [Alphaproteobacteria bacterium]
MLPSPRHALSALYAVTGREVIKFVHQFGRMASALVRPALWMLVFAAGFQNVFGVSIIEPYDTYITYQIYVLPGLLGIVLLFQGMQSSLSMVYDREMGVMRLLLTAPLPRWYLLLCKLIAGTLLSTLQAYAFLAACLVMTWILPWTDVTVPWSGWLYMFPAIVLGGLMLGAVGLLLSVYVQQLENFAGTMNFVIFPMFFISPALYPLWKLRESGAEIIYLLALANPFTYAIELIRYAAYGKLNGTALAVVVGSGVVFFLFAAYGYDPQRGAIRRTPQAAGSAA